MKLIKKKSDSTGEASTAPSSIKNSGWMATGYESMKKHIAQQVAQKKSSYVPEFWLKDGEEAGIRILTEPICIFSHRLMRPGRKVPDMLTCLEGTGQLCPLCEAGQKAYPRQWQAVYAVIDRRKEEWVDKQGTKHRHQNRVKLWRAGQRIAGLLEKKQSKFGDLRNYELEISRTGTAFNTMYSIEVGNKQPLTAAEKEARDKFDIIKVIQPKTRSELLALIGGVAEEESSEDGPIDEGLDI
jgi:hypothetical protein